MSRNDDDLLAAARTAAAQAHAPWSRFRVGAALLSEQGRLHLGCNVESAAFPSGSCAEQAAISAAVLAEGPAMRIARIAVVAFHDGVECPVLPCGACRQRIAEFGPRALVLGSSADQTPQRRPIETLLPEGFRLPPDDPGV